MADQNVNVKIRVSKTGTGATDAVKELERVKTTATGMSAGLKSAMGGIAPMFGAMGAAFAVSQVVRFGKETVMAASAAQESVNKMNVVFGASSTAITKFSANAASGLGMSRQQAVEASATFGNLFTSMGLSKAASADMSTGIVQLASDLGSFNNIPIDIMLEKMRSGMVGEVEPLRAVGINLSAAEVKAKALANGPGGCERRGFAGGDVAGALCRHARPKQKRAG